MSFATKLRCSQQLVDRHAEAFEVGSAQAEVDLAAVVADAVISHCESEPSRLTRAPTCRAAGA